MSEIITDKKRVNRLIILFMVTYMVSYLTRINYGAVLLDMVKSTGFTKDLLSLAVTGSFVTYGVGQVISGFIGDRIEPKKLIFVGLIITVCMNVLMIFCFNPYQMLVVWSINGFAQALMWPPLVRIMTTLFTATDYKKASKIVSWGSSFGTMLIYLVAYILISATSIYQTVFAFSALSGVIMIFVWLKFCPRVEIKKATTTESEIKTQTQTAKIQFPIVFFFIMLAVVLQGMLRDGVTTWMPTYIDEVYHLGDTAILSGVILPIFSILCISATSWLYKKIPNPVTCSAIMFGIGAVASVVLVFVPSNNAVMSMILMAVLTGAMHGVNFMLICMVPPVFNKTGKVSFVSGLLNSCTYVGSAIFTYGIAVLSEKAGWSFTLITWLVIAGLGAIVCLLCFKPWNKQQKLANFD